MPDLVSLVCPSCGGKLRVSRNATSLTCQYCGTEHMVKHEGGGAIMLEAYARCPVCGRNDRAEKVSAVIASQSHEISGVEQKTETITNSQGYKVNVVRDVPFTRSQVSVLGQRLAAPLPPDPTLLPAYPPPPPAREKQRSVQVIALGALAVLASFFLFGVLLLSFFGALNLYPDPESKAIYEMVFVTLAACCFPLGAGLIGLGVYLITRRRSQEQDRQSLYRQECERVTRERERIQGDHARALTRWQALYYCGRDDCVFIPGEGSSAPLANMQEYLLRPPPERPAPGS